MRKLSEKVYKFKQSLRDIFVNESDLRKSLREATNNEEWNPDTNTLYYLCDCSQNQEDFDLIFAYLERKLINVKESQWRRFTKIIELIIFLIRNGNEQYRNKLMDNSHILDRLSKYSYFDKKVDRGSLVRERAEYVKSIQENKNVIMEERIAGYRLRYGKAPEWAKEYLEKKELEEKDKNKEGVNQSPKKKNQKLKLNLKKFDDSDDYDITPTNKPQIRARTDEFFSVPAYISKQKGSKFKFDDQNDSDDDYEFNDKVAPLFHKDKKKEISTNISGTQSVNVKKGKNAFTFDENSSEDSVDNYDYTKDLYAEKEAKVNLLTKKNHKAQIKKSLKNSDFDNSDNKFTVKNRIQQPTKKKTDTSLQGFKMPENAEFGTDYIDPQFKLQMQNGLNNKPNTKLGSSSYGSTGLNKDDSTKNDALVENFNKKIEKDEGDEYFGDFDNLYKKDNKKSIKLSLIKK